MGKSRHCRVEWYGMEYGVVWSGMKWYGREIANTSNPIQAVTRLSAFLVKGLHLFESVTSVADR